MRICSAGIKRFRSGGGTTSYRERDATSAESLAFRQRFRIRDGKVLKLVGMGGIRNHGLIRMDLCRLGRAGERRIRAFPDQMGEPVRCGWAEAD